MRRSCVLIMVLCALLEFAVRGIAVRLGAALSRNPGVALGLLQGTPRAAAAVSAAALAVLLWCVLSPGRLGGGVRLALSVTAGGAAANLVQRLLAGAVTDWIPLPFSEPFIRGGLRFNLADVEIALGAAAALWLLSRGGREEN